MINAHPKAAEAFFHKVQVQKIFMAQKTEQPIIFYPDKHFLSLSSHRKVKKVILTKTRVYSIYNHYSLIRIVVID